MAYQLVSGVLDHAPSDATAAECLVLVALAEQSRYLGEVLDIPTADLVRRTRLGERGLRDALTRLAGRGIQVRVPLGKDRHGRPLYALMGQVPKYKLPELEIPAGCVCQSCRRSSEKAEPQLLHRKVEEPQHPEAEPQLRTPEPGPSPAGATAPPIPSVPPPSGVVRAVTRARARPRDPGRGERPPARAAPLAAAAAPPPTEWPTALTAIEAKARRRRGDPLPKCTHGYFDELLPDGRHACVPCRKGISDAVPQPLPASPNGTVKPSSGRRTRAGPSPPPAEVIAIGASSVPLPDIGTPGGTNVVHLDDRRGRRPP